MPFVPPVPLPHGAVKKHHPNGQLAEEYHYEHGVKHGPELDWAENGQKICEGNNRYGKRAGTWTWWHENGQLLETNTHDDQGRKQGPYTWHSASGAVRVTGAWLDDKRHGPWVWIDTEKHQREECGYHRGDKHGKDVAWYKNGNLAHKRFWIEGEKHGEEETFDEKGKPLFKGAWQHGHPVGTHLTWKDGKEIEETFVDGVPKSLTTNTKLRDKVIKRLKKAKDEYAKRDAFDDVDYTYRAAYVIHLSRGKHVDIADPDLWDLVGEAQGLLDGNDVITFLGAVKAKGLFSDILPSWPRNLDQIVMKVYARDPKPIDAGWKALPKPMKVGVAFVRARFGKTDLGKTLHAEIKRLAKELTEGGSSDVLWPDDSGIVAEVRLRDPSDRGTRTEKFAELIELFGGMDAFRDAMRAFALKEAAETVARVSFSTFREVIEKASVEEMVKYIDGIQLGDVYGDIDRAFHWRDDDAKTITKIALATSERAGRRAAVVAAIRGHEAAIPDKLVAALALESESPGFTLWQDGPLTQLPSEQRVLPHPIAAFLPAQRMAAVETKIGLVRDAFARLTPAQRASVIERHLADRYGISSTAQYLDLVDDVALRESAIDAIAANEYGRGDAVMYGLGELGPSVIPQLVAKGGYERAIVVAMARGVADGAEIDPALDAHVTFDLGDRSDFDRFSPFLYRILCGLPAPRAEAILVRALRDISPDIFARAFAAISACPTHAVLEVAFTTLLACEAKLNDAQSSQVCAGIGSLPNPVDWTRWLLLEGGGRGLGDYLRQAVGWDGLEKLKAELAAQGTPAAAAIDTIEKTRALAEELGGTGERVYLLRTLEGERDTGTLNVLGGAAPGVDAARWPTFEDEPMVHLFTLDVRTMPELAPRVGSDTRAVSVFCYRPSNNEAWENGTERTAVVFTTEAELAAKALSPEEVELRDLQRFEAVGLNVDPSVWTEKSELRKQLYGASARVLGEPLWLQDEDWADTFLMQFDESFCDINLGDSGIMYVFVDTAFWQCH